jgi:hypothetical protein
MGMSGHAYLCLTQLKRKKYTMTIVLDAIEYKNHMWQVRSDLIVTDLLLGLQGGFTK